MIYDLLNKGDIHIVQVNPRTQTNFNDKIMNEIHYYVHHKNPAILKLYFNLEI